METILIKKESGFSVQDLEVFKLGLLDRIKRLEADLKCPLDADFHEQASQISNQIILKRLLEIEKTQLRKINYEIEKRKQNR